MPLSAGGIADVMSRMVANDLNTQWGQPVVVENRPGAGTALGMAVVATAAPDGYTIGMGNIAANAIVPAMRPDSVPYHPTKDFTPISLVGVTPSLLVVNTDRISATTIPELIAYLKKNPGKVPYGSSGVGTSLHLGMELFMLKTGTTMVHVPYKGSAPMMTDLLSGEIHLALDALSTSGAHIKSGKLRALGVTTAQRAFFAPDVPAIAEFVPGYEMKAWHGVMGPAGMPEAIVAKLSAQIQAYLRRPDVEVQLKDRGVIRVGNTPAEFRTIMDSEYALFQGVIKQTGVKAE